MATVQKRSYLVSIGILNYHTDHLILNLIDKLGGASDTEILIVDNSDKNTLSSKLPPQKNVKYYHMEKNLGFSGGANFGIKHAKGKWIMFLNSDTVTTLSDIKKLINVAEENNASAAAPRLVDKNNKYQRSVGYFDSFLKSPLNYLFVRPRFISFEDGEKKVDVATAAALLVKREVFNQYGYFDSKSFFMYFEDIDFCYRLYKRGVTILYAPSVKIVHYGGVSSDKNKIDKKQNYQKGLYNYLLKHRGVVLAKLNQLIPFFR